MELACLYNKLQDNECLHETLVNTFYQWKYEKYLTDDEKIDIFESWLATKASYDNLNYNITKSLYYLLKYTILTTHTF